MADAKRVWIGNPAGTNKEWQDVANWDTGIPALDDLVFFDGTGQANVVFNTTVPVTNMKRFEFSQSYGGSVGDSGTPCPVGTSAAKTVYQGSGAQAWFNGTFQDFVGRSDQAGQQSLNFAGTVTAKLALLRGLLNVLSGAVLTGADIFTGWLESPANDAHLLLQAGIGSVGNMFLNGGRVTLNTDAVSIQSRNTALEVITGDIGTLLIDGGTVTYRADQPPTGNNIDLCYLKAGTLDMSKDGRAKLIDILHHWGGATFNANNGGNNIVVTNYFTYGNANIIPGSTDLGGIKPV